MPPPDVRFDHVAAVAAIDEAKRVRDLLEAWITVQATEVGPVLARWSGGSRDQAEAVLSAHTGRVSEIVDRLRLFAAELEDAREAARYEQGRRVGQQVEWQAEWGKHPLVGSAREVPAGPGLSS